MATKRTPLKRRSLVITDEIIDLFLTIQREFKAAGERQTDAGIDAHNKLHLLLDLWPCHPSPALVHSPEPEGANEFITACYRDSWAIRQRIEQAIGSRT